MFVVFFSSSNDWLWTEDLKWTVNEQHPPSERGVKKGRIDRFLIMYHVNGVYPA